VFTQSTLRNTRSAAQHKRYVSDQFGFNFQNATPLARRIFSVRDLVGAVRTAVEREYSDIYVEGEISNFRPAESGHLYFTLKDGDAQVRIVMFRSQTRLLRFKPANGMQIIARGRVTIYEQRGELQLSAEYLEPKGAGALQVAFEQLKARLAEEGLFDQSRKKPLPMLPRSIGIVTSPRGAAVQDMLNILRRRHEGINILIFPAQVQGEAASAEVSSGVRYFNRAKNVDVIVVARGGGSVEDLAAFNEEGLARTIAGSDIPVISAIGHETDFTIADFVADLRAPTPSAAAELVIESRHQLDERIENRSRRLNRAMDYRLLMHRKRLTELAQHGAFARMMEGIHRRTMRMDDLASRLADVQRSQFRHYRSRVDIAITRIRAHDVRRVLSGMKREVETQTGRLSALAHQALLQQRSRVQTAEGKLEALSPLNILDRGYAIVFDSRGNIIKDPAALTPGAEITARVSKGTFKANVKK
jgi:exodeoxyribonuclease VII large subunit